MKTFEVEIKSLLGSKENADKLKGMLAERFPGMKLVGHGKQLNHYFSPPRTFDLLKQNLGPVISADKKSEFEHILADATKLSIRTRDADGKVSFVVKASVAGGTSSNGVTRVEFESAVRKTLAELDKILLDSGYSYQAKWSREREEYEADEMHICIDKNAGYGYLAEFEKVTTDESTLEAARTGLLSVMKSLGTAELPQDRLERMFAHYNAHWSEYYGTEKTFIVE